MGRAISPGALAIRPGFGDNHRGRDHRTLTPTRTDGWASRPGRGARRSRIPPRPRTHGRTAPARSTGEVGVVERRKSGAKAKAPAPSPACVGVDLAGVEHRETGIAVLRDGRLERLTSAGADAEVLA